jgi:hypothetical protein
VSSTAKLVARKTLLNTVSILDRSLRSMISEMRSAGHPDRQVQFRFSDWSDGSTLSERSAEFRMMRKASVF